MITKILKCQKCGNKTRKRSNFQKYCKSCSKIVIKESRKRRRKEYPERFREYKRKSYLKHKEKVKERNLKWQRKNPEKVREMKRRHRRNNIEKVREYENEYRKQRKKVDITYAIICRLRSRKNNVIRRAIKTGKIPKDFNFMGIKTDYKSILEALKPFPKDISKYHIDEIFPFAAVNWNNMEDIKRVLAPKNHQWLSIKDNLKKGGKILENGHPK